MGTGLQGVGLPHMDDRPGGVAACFASYVGRSARERPGLRWEGPRSTRIGGGELIDGADLGQVSP